MDLFAGGFLPGRFAILGISRTPHTDQQFRDYVREVIGERHDHGEKLIERFLLHIEYLAGDVTKDETYKEIASRLDKIDKKLEVCTNKLFHLSVAPGFYPIITQKLAESGLASLCATHEDQKTWTRLLVEKPFGEDADECEKLDELLGRLYDERQVFRVDHYLAKESMQNILSFRFSNDLFEALWNKENVESVHINFREKSDADTRGAFYDATGALRDVVQNHMLQMLSLVAMENPVEWNDKAIRAKREELMDSLEIPKSEGIETHAMRAQYEGFRETKGVADDSLTETYCCVKASIDNDRWMGVPFYLEAGKGLDKDNVSIVVTFKEVDACLCPPDELEHKHQNKVTFSVKPTESIDVSFWSKKPGFTLDLEERALVIDYGKIKRKKKIPYAYEHLIYDCLLGDQTLFASTKEVKKAWQFVTAILDSWDKLPLVTYEKGSAGPEKPC